MCAVVAGPHLLNDVGGRRLQAICSMSAAGAHHELLLQCVAVANVEEQSTFLLAWFVVEVLGGPGLLVTPQSSQ